GPTVSLIGEVRRPAIYEMRGETTVGEAVELGGGLTPQADPGNATLERITDSVQRTLINVDLSTADGRNTKLRNGDTLRFSVIRSRTMGSVEILGHVDRPRSFQFHPGLRLSEVVPSLDELNRNADQHYLLVRREDPRTRHISVVSADLAKALAAPG